MRSHAVHGVVFHVQHKAGDVLHILVANGGLGIAAATGAGAGIFLAAARDILGFLPCAHGVLCAGVHNLLAAGAYIPVVLGVIAHGGCFVLMVYLASKAVIQRTITAYIANYFFAGKKQRGNLAGFINKGVASRCGNLKGDMVLALFNVGGVPPYIRVDCHGVSVHIRCGKAQLAGFTDFRLLQIKSNGRNKGVFCCRCFIHHQLDDMLVAENADVAAVLFQI